MSQAIRSNLAILRDMLIGVGRAFRLFALPSMVLAAIVMLPITVIMRRLFTLALP